MSSPATPLTSDESDPWREIESVVDHITRLARSPVTPDRFFVELLEGSVRTLAAIGGAVWLQQPEGLQLIAQINLSRTGLVRAAEAEESPDLDERARRHLVLLHQTLSETEPRALSPRAGGANPEATQNPTDFLLLLSPLKLDNEPVGVLEVFQRTSVTPGARQGFLRFLTALSDLAADFLRNSRLRELQERAALWTRFEHFAEQVHQGLDVRRIASAVANEGRLLIECSRLSVGLRHGSGYRIMAVSGVDTVNRRSPLIRSMERLAHRIVPTREPFWFVEGTSVPAPLEPLLREVLEGTMRMMAVLPLVPGHSASGTTGDERTSRRSRTPERPVGVLIVEWQDGSSDPALRRLRSEVVARQSAAALANALEHSQLPFLSLLRFISRIGWYLRLRQLPRTALVTGLIAAVVAALILVPAELTIDGRGELQPSLRRGVFAAADGIVDSLSDKLHGNEPAPVQAGEVLVTLRNADLDFEFTRITGELRTAKQGLATTEVERVSVDRSDPRWQTRLDQLAAQAAELKERIVGLEAELKVLERQQSELKQVSPVSGQVLTWDALRTLQSRPVRRGDLLLEVADVDGPWVLEIRVPDQNIEYVQSAVRGGEDVKVSFVLATDPEVVRTGHIREIARDTRPHPVDGPTVLVTVEIDRTGIPASQLRPGATVIPHIHCGSRPVGFVWFHELWHIIQTRLLF